MGGLGTTTTMALIVGPFIVLWLLRRLVQREPDRVIARMVVIGLLAKLAGTAAYYLAVAEVWGGGDVHRYVREGRRLVPIIRSGVLPDQARESGTPFMDFLTGVVFSIVGPNEVAGYLAFSLLSFVGMYLFLQAFRLALPGANHRRYAFLVLFLPTMLFWPSTIGKEAWMVFTLGVAAYGAARALRRQRFGYLLLVGGVLGIAAIRPHMAALFAVSFTISYVLRIRDRSLQQSAGAWVAGLIIVAIGTGLAAANFSEEMGGGEGEGSSFTERIVVDTDAVFERAERNTRRGGGEFQSRPVRTPVDFIYAAVTVPFRPFIFEAHNLTARLNSVESMLLLLLAALTLPRLLTSLSTALLRLPYLALATTFTVGFIIAFSNVGNFGLLARYRAMLLPFLLVPLALPHRPVESPEKRRASTDPVLWVAPGGGVRQDVDVTPAGPGPAQLTARPESTETTPDT
jgi:hypothetical protein